MKLNPMLPDVGISRKENAERTRESLVEAGIELFTTYGFAAVSTVQICEHLGVTRGALYHHFKNKTDLMEACFSRVDHRLVARLAGLEAAGPTDQIRATCREFVDQLGDPVVRQILFVEAPAALGWARWRELDGGRSLELVRNQLAAVADAGLLGTHDPRILAHLLLGALNELAMFVAASSSTARATALARQELELLLNDLLARTDTGIASADGD
ncbi:MAG: TetR/AcrR family transcriptional regulator [Nocardiaceae bacterium]|nr:TetR/AcrR family transcriptional regulator [Nocardiaceae bacterium]